MTLKVRQYRGESDFWLLRAFLRDVFLLNGRLERAWQAYRWDYWCRHGVENLKQGILEEQVFIWQTPDDRVAAFLTPEGAGNAFLQVHPGFESAELVSEMIDVAEAHLQRKTENGSRLNVWVNEHQAIRRAILTERGYKPGKWVENQRRQRLDREIQAVPVPEGYVVRALGDIGELPSRSWASWKAFHPENPDEEYDGWEWYRNIQRCPLYRRDLDIVAVSPSGEIASFTTVWFDDATRTGSFEPVGTHVDHWRRGLGKAVMTEGLRRLQQLGADLAYVGSFSEPAHRLYESMGFTDVEKAEQWTREWE